jgi:sulfur carrier protein ThiS adenylyltransferase
MANPADRATTSHEPSAGGDPAPTPSRAEVRAALAGRMGEAHVAALEAATVGVAGLGGLGSQIALALARTGVGHLRLVDFDVVDLANLNRQAYDIADLGRPKTDAIAARIAAINPYVDVRMTRARVTADNAAELFADAPVVCEAFDDPIAKAMLTETLLGQRGVVLIGASGMAGHDRTDTIATRRVGARWWLCGDETSDIGTGAPMVAPRVMACAGAQAMLAIRVILGLET